MKGMMDKAMGRSKGKKTQMMMPENNKMHEKCKGGKVKKPK